MYKVKTDYIKGCSYRYGYMASIWCIYGVAEKAATSTQSL